MEASTPTDTSSKKLRKPYTITKSRESWTEEEHEKFLEALQLFDRDWKKIEDFVGSKTVIQIRSHAQKYFLKAQKNGTTAHVPPPRPKRKATHLYPQKTSKNELAALALQASLDSPTLSCLASDYFIWDDASIFISTESSGDVPSINEYPDVLGVEGMAGSFSGDGCSSPTVPSCEIPKQESHTSLLNGIPDFAEVYSFIGSVFDPDSIGHVQKLREMDPINFETVLLLMRNLTINLSSPDFEPIREVLSSYDMDTENLSDPAGAVDTSQI
ncbi:hypothetical protein GIB67_030339 [Kingdonia uniflora]|uniref:Uncharacterized protein n=1 Tax=Kingdonia uniflora TaxID=39325 RepID=A0A7J7M705_9MAGN|nr:hypothetical protein GIB67_030339 [Kingdonia uniflora]